jgi:O-antigen/teichoic acid export membrane protein
LLILLKRARSDMCKEKIEKLGWQFYSGILQDTLIFTLAGAALNFVLYGDRWLMAEFSMSFEMVAVYSVVTQASLLVVLVLEQVSKIFVPLISNLENVTDIGQKNLKKFFFTLFIFMISVPIIGGLTGYLYITFLFGVDYWEKGQNLYWILIFGLVFYPIQMFSRGFLIRFHSVFLTLVLNCVAGFILLAVIILASEDYGVLTFAFARASAFVFVGVSFFCMVFLPLLKRVTK